MLGGTVFKKKRAKLPKASTAGTPKKAKQKGTGGGAKSGKSTHAPPGLQTPNRKKVKTHSLQSNPSTVTSISTRSSKCTVSMMNGLAITSPPKKTKSVQDATSAIDFDNATMIDWPSKEGLCEALQYHGEDQTELKNMDFHAKVVLLCGHFKPNDIRPTFQGIYQEAGKNWRSLKLAKHKSMKTLAREFVKACVDIVNARRAFSVPGNIIIKKENLSGSANA